MSDLREEILLEDRDEFRPLGKHELLQAYDEWVRRGGTEWDTVCPYVVGHLVGDFESFSFRRRVGA